MGFGQWIIDAVSWVPAPLAVFLLAMSPVWEVRMSIAVAILVYDMHWFPAVALSFAGNLLVVPLLHRFFPSLARLVRRSERGARWLDGAIRRTRRKRGEKVEKAREAVIVGLIGVPLPGTGAWTGAFVAQVFGLSLRRALPFYVVGIAIACAITTALVLAGYWGVKQL